MSEFKCYLPPKDQDLRRLFGEATFVFDTNIFLNLYKYKKSTVDKFFEVMSRCQTIFIPHHVMLEFYRNRLSIIYGQRRELDEAKDILEKQSSKIVSELQRRNLITEHSVVDWSDFKVSLEQTVAIASSKIEESKGKIVDLDEEDHILKKIEAIFEKFGGCAFAEQSVVDKLGAEGKRRFDASIPPGFKDKVKSTRFLHGQIVYNSEFGDYYIWEQLLDESRVKGYKTVFLVTEDSKEDLWQYLDSSRKYGKIGPRFELKSEIFARSGVETFHAFSSLRFLDYASEIWGISLDDLDIGDIERSRAQFLTEDFILNELDTKLQKAEDAVGTFYVSRIEPSELLSVEKESEYPQFRIVSHSGLIVCGVSIVEDLTDLTSILDYIWHIWISDRLMQDVRYRSLSVRSVEKVAVIICEDSESALRAFLLLDSFLTIGVYLFSLKFGFLDNGVFSEVESREIYSRN